MVRICLLLTVIIALVFTSCHDNEDKKADKPQEVDTNKFLLTDSSWGKIRLATTYKDLVDIFGESSIVNERICGPECVDSLDVTIIKRGTPEEIIVYWHINRYQQEIASLQSYAEGAPYHTLQGLKIGSTLAELLKINKQHINFAGFGWDYGGYIHTYNGGTLENTPVQFRLELDEENSNALQGDTELHSEMEEVKERLDKIRIAQIYLSFEN